MPLNVWFTKKETHEKRKKNPFFFSFFFPKQERSLIFHLLFSSSQLSPIQHVQHRNSSLTQMHFGRCLHFWSRPRSDHHGSTDRETRSPWVESCKRRLKTDAKICVLVYATIRSLNDDDGRHSSTKQQQSFKQDGVLLQHNLYASECI